MTVNFAEKQSKVHTCTTLSAHYVLLRMSSEDRAGSWWGGRDGISPWGSPLACVDTQKAEFHTRSSTAQEELVSVRKCFLKPFCHKMNLIDTPGFRYRSTFSHWLLHLAPWCLTALIQLWGTILLILHFCNLLKLDSVSLCTKLEGILIQNLLGHWKKLSQLRQNPFSTWYYFCPTSVSTVFNK